MYSCHFSVINLSVILSLTYVRTIDSWFSCQKPRPRLWKRTL